MKKSSVRRIPLAGFLASGFAILFGFLVTTALTVAFSNAPQRDLVLVAGAFAVITLIPFNALRSPKDPMREKPAGWRWLSWKKGRKKPTMLRGKYWKRKKGQDSHQPFGTRELPRSSTFVPSPREPRNP